MRDVIGRIEDSVAESPRPVVVVYYNPVFAEIFENKPAWSRLFEGSEFGRYWARTQTGNKEANEFVSGNRDGERFVVYANQWVELTQGEKIQCNTASGTR